MKKTDSIGVSGGFHDAQGLPTRNKVWIVTGSALGLAFGFSPFFGVSGVFMKPLAESFNWGRADVALLPMLAMLGNAIGALIVGILADRIGWKRVIGAAIVMFSLALLMLSRIPPNHLLFALIGGLIGLTGAATSAAGYIAILPDAFDKRLGMALSFAMIGTGLGGFVMPIFSQKLLGFMDWRSAYMTIAACALVFGLLAHRVIFHNFKGMDPVRAKDRETRIQVEDEGEGITFREALKTPRFWLLAFVFFFVSCSVLGGYVHLPPYLSDRGLGRDVGAQAAATVGIGLMVARVGLGAMLDRVFAPIVATVAFLASAVVFWVLTTDMIKTPGIVTLCALVWGMSIGSEGDLIPYIARRYFGRRELSSIYGALFGASTLGGAVGPFLYGLAFDHLHTYASIHLVSAVVCVVCAGGILLIGRYPGRERTTGQLGHAAPH